MADSLIDTLPLPQRLALSYAPARARAATLAVLALDARLGQGVAQANEPIMGQMRLAWWRDQLALDPEKRERSDALICALDGFGSSGKRLVTLVDGWEALLAEELDEGIVRTFASARSEAFLLLARQLGAPDETDTVLQAGQLWAMADLASGLSDDGERQIVLELAASGSPSLPRLSRSLRPLAVLGGLARRSLNRGGHPMLTGPLSVLTAIRLGLAGR